MKKRLVSLLCVFSLLVALLPQLSLPVRADKLSVSELNSALLRDNSFMDNNILVSSAELCNKSGTEAAAKAALNENGFETLLSDYRNYSSGDHSKYTIAYKNINGYNVYAVVIRGTDGGAEWVSNFKTGGCATISPGFGVAAAEICDKLRNVMDAGQKEKNIVWLTGHSRGGAVANIIAAMFLNGENRYVSTKRVHTYTFACPNVTLAPNGNMNIYNFNFNEDIVPSVPLSSWGYGRNGKTYTANYSQWVEGGRWSATQVKSFVNSLGKAVPSGEGYSFFYSYLIKDFYGSVKSIADEFGDWNFVSAMRKLQDLFSTLPGLTTAVYSVVYNVNVAKIVAAIAGYHPYFGDIGPIHKMSNYLKWIRQAYPTDTDTSAAGTYVVNGSGSSAVYRSGPYSDCDVKGRLASGTRLTVVYSIRNAKGNTWYKLGGDYAECYIYADNVSRYVAPPASTLNITVNIQSASMTEGGTNKLIGTISSNYSLNDVTAKIDGRTYSGFCTPVTSLSVVSSSINTGLNFSALGVGQHVIDITVADSGGGVQTRTIYFDVASAVNAPKFSSITDVSGGKLARLYCTTPGATIRYTLDGSAPTRYSPVYPYDGIFLTYSARINAAAFTDAYKSGVCSQYVTVAQTAMPVIETAATPSGTRVALSSDSGAQIYYSLRGESYQPYYAPFILAQESNVSAYAEKLGSIRSEENSEWVTVSPPTAPTISMPESGTRIPQGSSVTVRWNPLGDASSYTVHVEMDSVPQEDKTVNEANATFLLSEVAEYRFTVQAGNDIGGVSDESEAVTVSAMAPSIVTFVDWDGSVISEQTVAYGADAAVPADPERAGHYFRYWDGDCSSITEDTTINAVYQIIEYTVIFLDSDGSRLSTQSVPYLSGAVPPVESVKLLSGYSLLGWSVSAESAGSMCDYTQVDSNMTLKAVVGWENSELPVIAQISAANRNDDEANGNYSVTVLLTNTPDEYTTALLRVSLKTAEGKMVKTESRTIGLAAGAAGEEELFTLNYSGTATVAEAVVLGYNGDYLTGSAYSEAATSPITVISDYVYGAWTDWSAELDPSYDDYETKTQYRSRSKETTTSSSASLSGWTMYDRSSYWGNWSAPSGWTTSYVAGSDSVQVETKTQYKYYRCYCNINSAHGWYGGAYCSASGSGCSGYCYYDNREYIWSDVSYDTAYATWGNATASGVVKRSTLGTASWWYYNSGDGTNQGARTVYQYRTRTLYNTYYYYKWSNWSAWQDSPITATGDRQVETITLYRHRNKDVPVYSSLSGIEDTSGELHEFSGAIPDSGIALEGKLATVMAYKGKNSDPNESQLQYVGQTVLGAGNEYSFSFKTKDEPSVVTGDYVVCLGIQGATGLVKVGIIEAPKPQYTVNYYGMDGELIDMQLVSQGENAVAPESPLCEGYTFVTWSEGATNVHGDLNITAKYVPKTYAVVFVDWINGTASPFACEYGADLTVLAEQIIPAADGHSFNGWDEILAGNTVVTGNMVISAVFVPETYNVCFYGGTGDDRGLIDRQSVAWGQSAELPEFPQLMDVLFHGWSTDEEWWNVRHDMDVYPILSFAESASQPVFSIGQRTYGESELLELTAGENAAVYYTMDGSEPVPGENALEYSEPIEVTHADVVRAVASEPGKNLSEVIDVYLDYGENTGRNPEVIDVGTYNAIVNPGDTVTVRVNINDNPGLLGYMFFVECDTAAFYVDYDEASGYSVEQGELTDSGGLLLAPYEDSGWSILWYDTAEAVGDGGLFTLTLKVSGEAEPGTYPIKVSYSAENMLGADFEEVAAKCDGSVTGARTIGDANGDGCVTLADVVLIARHIVGLSVISNMDALLAADANQDGNITTADVVKLSRVISGLDSL